MPGHKTEKEKFAGGDYTTTSRSICVSNWASSIHGHVIR